MSKTLLCMLVIIQPSLLFITNLFRKTQRIRVLDNKISIFHIHLISYQITTTVFKERFLQSLTLNITKHTAALPFGTINMISSNSLNLMFLSAQQNFFTYWNNTFNWRQQNIGHWLNMDELQMVQNERNIFFLNRQNVTAIKPNRMGKHKICRNNRSSSASYLADIPVLKHHT